jgi:hypothetical protein
MGRFPAHAVFISMGKRVAHPTTKKLEIKRCNIFEFEAFCFIADSVKSEYLPGFIDNELS